MLYIYNIICYIIICYIIILTDIIVILLVSRIYRQVVKNSPATVRDAEDLGSIPGLGTSSGGGNGNPLQYSCLDISIDKEACQATVHGVG